MDNKLKAAIGRFWRCERGSPAIEFALIAPFLMIMIIGTIDFGLAVRAKSETEAAARAALQKGFGNMWDEELMAAAAKEALSTDPAVQGELSLEATASCYCDGALTESGDSCTKESTCGGGGRPDYYLTVDVSRPFELMIDYFVMPQTMTLSGSATARTQP